MKRTLNTTINRSKSEKNIEKMMHRRIFYRKPRSRPTARTSGGVAASFAYNERSEVVSAQIGTNLFAHSYDYIGNQTNFVENALTNTFTHNALNQIETATVPQFSIFNFPRP